MKRTLLMTALVGCFSFAAGCDRNTSTGSATGPGPGTTATPPGAMVVFRVDPESVTIPPGGEAKVKLLSVPKEGNLKVTIDPPTSKINAMADRDVLTVRAANDAEGQSTVTVAAGKESAKLVVRVEKKK